MRKLAEIFATVVYIGRLPLAPGTWCSFVSLSAWYILRFWMADNFFLYGSLVLFFVWVAVSTIHAETLGKDDPSEIVIDEDGTIHMYNDGNGIDIAQHPEYKMWIPEMIFGHLRTSTNYDEKKKEKIIGGKNGFGFKLVLIWSTWGKIETVDHIRGLKYVQEFKNNLNEISKPSITKCKTKPLYMIRSIPIFFYLNRFFFLL